jgi:putative DNA methylase
MSTLASRKKLIEVSIPLEAINKEALRRKQKAPKGFPTAIHKYWAQRPIALCRAVLFAQLVDDPDNCVEEFPSAQARQVERDRLHALIERLIIWENSNNETILTEARYEIARSLARARGEKLPPPTEMGPQQIIEYLQKHAPLICDPFAGAGSIPLEAQRLGLRIASSDLNPLAVLITKALIEFPPTFAGRKPFNPEVNELRHWKGAQGLAEDIRYYGRWMREQAEAKIGQLYPKVRLQDNKDHTVIAWLWARTVASPDPRARGAHVPIASTFLLSSKVGKEVIAKPSVDRARMTWTFEIDEKPSRTHIEAARTGTKVARGANFVCLLTGAAIDEAHVKAEAMAGRMSAALIAIVAEERRGRVYVAPTSLHMKAAAVDELEAAEIDQAMPENPRWFSPPEYGMPNYKDLFTPRQLVALTTFSDLVTEARDKALADARKHWSGHHADDARRLADEGRGPVAYADAIATYLALVVNRMVFYGSSLTRWLSKDNAMGQSMSQQALAMTWDFAEGNPLGQSSSAIHTCTKAISDCVEATYARFPATVGLRDAQLNAFDHGTVFSTDPPYYDNVGYADLSDFFYVWLRRSLSTVHPNLFRRVLTPKTEELVATPYRHGGKEAAEQHFMEGMRTTLQGFASAMDGSPAAIYYAYKQREFGEDALTSPGWASFLQAVAASGLVIDGTWPVRSESEGRSVASGTNALASSIVLVCLRR